MSEAAKVFEDREHAGDWRVEFVDDDGGCEVAIFAGPNARERRDQVCQLQYRNIRRNQPVALECDPRGGRGEESPASRRRTKMAGPCEDPGHFASEQGTQPETAAGSEQRGRHRRVPVNENWPGREPHTPRPAPLKPVRPNLPERTLPRVSNPARWREFRGKESPGEPGRRLGRLGTR